MSKTNIITGKCRASFVEVFEAKSFNGGKPKYSISLIIPKNDTATINNIKAAIGDAIEEGKAKLADKNGRVNPATIKSPLRDGDIDRADDPAYANSFFLNASSTHQPGIVDQRVQPILDPDEFYSGCYCRADINFYAFNVPGNKGIACGLNNLQKLGDGPRFSGGAPASAVFTVADDDSTPFDEDDLGL